jgi:hypothetical protein
LVRKLSENLPSCFVVGRVEAVVVEVAERHLDAVELEGQSRVATRHRHHAVRGMLELADVVIERMRRLRAGHLSDGGH